MPWLLNAIYVALVVVVSPFLIARCVRQGKYRRGWCEKLLGSVPSLEPNAERYWFHAVSVGEVLLLRGVISELRSRRPDVEIVLSTTTQTGHDVARKHFPETVVFYCPLDFSWAVGRAIRRLKPTALVLAELELWPNLVLQASAHGVGLAIINGRLSEKSYRGYRKLRPLVARLLRRFDVIAVQSDEYAARFIALGASSERVVVTGSVKYDGVQTDRRNPQTCELRRVFGLADDALVFVAGSTQHPEEEYALRAWKELVREFPKLRLILVPRHQERFDEVAALVEGQGLPLLRRSNPAASPGGSPIILLDTLGELGACWGLADVAFVGGSLTNRGGQNMIEPAAFGAAVVLGPNTWNFREAVKLLLSADAARVVHDADEFTKVIRQLLGDPGLRESLGVRARGAVSLHRGATERTLELLVHSFSGAGLRRNVTVRTAA